MNWMNTAQAEHMFEDYEREEARKNRLKLPQKEADALPAYRRADAETKRAIEEHARARGWTVIDDWKTRITEKMTRVAEINRRIAARITTQEEAATLAKRAWKNGDRDLHAAIREVAQTKNWSLTMTPAPKNTTDLAAETHKQFTELLASRDDAIAPYAADLQAGRITDEYVANQLAPGAAERNERLIAIKESVNQHYAAAEAEYEKAYQSLAATSGDTTEQLLTEMRATKAWERTQRELANLDAIALLSQLNHRVKEADPTTLRVLMEEMPSYLTSRGVPNAADLVRHAIGQRPELADASARMTQAARLRDVTVHNSNKVSEVLNTITASNTGEDARVAYVDPTSINY